MHLPSPQTLNSLSTAQKSKSKVSFKIKGILNCKPLQIKKKATCFQDARVGQAQDAHLPQLLCTALGIYNWLYVSSTLLLGRMLFALSELGVR
jgi:hypothetical protein